MSLCFEDFRDVNSKIFAAALDPARWVDVLEAISSKVGDFPIHIFGADTARHVSYGHLTFGYDPEFLAVYEPHYAARNPWLAGFSAMELGVPTYCSEMCPDEQLKQSEFYHDWLVPQERISRGGGAIIHRHADSMFVIGGNIRQKDQEKLEDRWISVVGQLIDPLMHAWSISIETARGAFERALLQRTRELDPAILVLGSSGQIGFLNDAAATLLIEGSVLRVDVRGRAQFAQERARRAFARSALALRNDGFPLATAVDLHDARRMLISAIDPAVLCDWWAVDLLGLSEPSLLIVVSAKPSERTTIDRLIRAYGLTQSEAEVAEMFAHGLTLAEVAEARDVSIHTARHQLKAGMQKAGVRRQVEFAALVIEMSHS